MSISPINGSNSIYTTQYPYVTSTNSGSDTGSSAGSVGAAGSGKFADAIQDALSQLGVSTNGTSSTASSSASSGTSDAAAAQDPQQALSAFAQSLFAALQAQSGGKAGNSSNGNSSGSSASGANAISGASGGGGGHHHHHGGGGVGKLESGLQNLIQQLSSSPGQDVTGSGTSDSSSSSSANSSLGALQQSFNNLLSADGASGSSATLSNFLQSLSQNLVGAPATGNVVSTRV